MEIINRTYYTLEDLVKKVTSSGYSEIEIGNVYKPANFTYPELFAKYVADDATITVTAYNKDEMNALFCTYIYPKYKDMFVGYTDVDNPTSTDEAKVYRVFCRHLLNRLRKSYDEYKALLTYYGEIKDNLLAAISTQTKFNDTPQTTTSAGITSYDDTYNSTVTTTYQDGGTLMTRFNEISDTIYDIYDR